MKGILFKPWKIKLIGQMEPDDLMVTRRVINPQPQYTIEPVSKGWTDYVASYGRQFIIDRGYYNNDALMNRFIDSRYKVDEVVYIKEAWQIRADNCIEYKLTSRGYVALDGWRSPLFLPEKYARYFIRIKDVRAERLQEIHNNLDDFVKEGYKTNDKFGWEWFGELWDSINKIKWESNPYIFRYEFKREIR